MLKKGFNILIMFSIIMFASCSSTAPTQVNNNYLVAEFQQGVLPYSGYSGCSDTNMASTAPYYDYNYGASTEGSMGYLSGGPYITRYMVKFDIGSIPAGVTVKKAYLTLNSYMTGGAGTLSAHKINFYWYPGVLAGAAGTPSWNSTSGGTPFDTAASGAVTIAGGKYYTFELSAAMVQAWVNDSSVNNGVLIKGDDETVNSWIWCYFSETANVQFRPKLTVYYTL
jgi:hypothetical protein